MGRGPSLATADLLDRYLVADGTVLLTGVQALVRLVLDQSRADRAAGLDTGRVRDRVPRVATGRPGPRARPAPPDPRVVRRGAPPRAQRGARRDGRRRQPALHAPARPRQGRGLRDVVRQGAGARPRVRRAATRQPHGRGADGRGAGLRGRRPAGPVVERAVDVGADPLLARHADTEPGRPPGDPRPRAPRLRDVASLGPLGRGAGLGVGRRRRPERRRRPGPRRAAAPGPRGRRPPLRAPGERPAAGRDAARARGHALRQPHRGRAAPTAS